MPRRLVPLAIIVSAGLSVGIFGGLLNGEGWYHGGEAILFFGSLVWYFVEFWKRPLSILEMVDASEGEISESTADPGAEARRRVEGRQERSDSAF